MTTIVNTPASASDNSGSSGLIIGTFAVIVLAIIFIYFGLPALRNMGTPNISIPAPVINVPDKIDVNVQQTP